MLIIFFGFHVLLAASPHAESKEMEAAVQRGRLPGRSWDDQKSTAWGELLVSSDSWMDISLIILVNVNTQRIASIY
jgi:hypothetical protein